MDGATAAGAGAMLTSLASTETAGMAPTTATFWDALAPESTGTAVGQLLFKQVTWSGTCGA